MTLACTKVHAYGIEIGEGLTKRFHQHVLLEGTGATSDVSHNLSTIATGAGASALTAALADIGVRAEQLVSVAGETLVGKVKAAAAGAGVYAVSISNHKPTLTYNTAEGPTTFQYHLSWVLKDGERPVEIQAS